MWQKTCTCSPHSLCLWSFEGSWLLRSGFGDHHNGCGHRCGSFQILGGAGVCSLVHVPHLVHQEDRLRLPSSGSSAHWTDALLCVQRPPNLQPARELGSVWTHTVKHGKLPLYNKPFGLQLLEFCKQLTQNAGISPLFLSDLLSRVFPGELHNHILFSHHRAADSQIPPHSHRAWWGLDHWSRRRHGVWWQMWNMCGLCKWSVAPNDDLH